MYMCDIYKDSKREFDLPNKQDDIIDQLMALDKETLAKRAAQRLGKYQKELQKRDRLIADLTAQRDRAEEEASEIIKDAHRQAYMIKQEAQAVKDRAEHKLQKVEEDVARKIANANAEADSIVETHLSAASSKINELEGKRIEAKRMALVLNSNIDDECEHMLEKLENYMSGIRDLQAKIHEISADIEAEDFKTFDMRDYITPKKQTVEVAPQTEIEEEKNTTFDEDDFAVLGDLLSEEASSSSDYTYIPEEPEEKESDVLETEKDEEAYEDKYEDDDLDFSDIDDIIAENKAEEQPKEDMKSFTTAFMAIDDSDDEDDLDFDDILDKDDDLSSLGDDDFDEAFGDFDDVVHDVQPAQVQATQPMPQAAEPQMAPQQPPIQQQPMPQQTQQDLFDSQMPQNQQPLYGQTQGQQQYDLDPMQQMPQQQQQQQQQMPQQPQQQSQLQIPQRKRRNGGSPARWITK